MIQYASVLPNQRWAVGETGRCVVTGGAVLSAVRGTYNVRIHFNRRVMDLSLIMNHYIGKITGEEGKGEEKLQNLWTCIMK